MATNKPPTKIKFSWMDILFQSLSVVIPVLLGALVQVINDPDVKVEVEIPVKTEV